MEGGGASCPFCEGSRSTTELAANEHAVAIPDAFPVCQGHTLILPRRHTPTVFDLRREEQAAVWALVLEVKELLEVRHRPDGFNVGTNAGPAAGQTVPHAHVHVIPRHHGDVGDPRGGVRWVLSAKARYWGGP